MSQHLVLEDVAAEMDRQTELWGDQSGLPDGTGKTMDKYDLAIYRKQNKIAAAAKALTLRLILLEEVFEALVEKEAGPLREELIQVAAVAATWVEAIDKRGAK